jgi:hypothetical protein
MCVFSVADAQASRSSVQGRGLRAAYIPRSAAGGPVSGGQYRGLVLVNGAKMTIDKRHFEIHCPNMAGILVDISNKT